MKLSALSLTLVLAACPVAFAADLDEAFQALKDAEARKDLALLKKCSADAQAAAQEIIKSPAPQSEEAKKTWTERVNYAREVASHAEYALFALAVESPAATQIDLFATLEAQNPKSKYLDDAYARYFYALSQTGATAKIVPIAEKALANLPDNEDLLMVLMDNALTRQQADRAAGFANRLVGAMQKHAKPESLSVADWEKKRTGCLGRGYWVAGVVAGEKEQYLIADRNLRAALPLVKGNDAMMGPAYYFLGFANYKLGMMTNNKAKVLEAARFSDQAAAIAGPYQQQAWKNAQVMKTDAARMR